MKAEVACSMIWLNFKIHIKEYIMFITLNSKLQGFKYALLSEHKEWSGKKGIFLMVFIAGIL